MNPEHFDYKQYPDGNMDHRPHYDLGNDDQIAGESAYAAARMALMSAGKLTPEQVIRTSEYHADWSAFADDTRRRRDMTTRRNRARKPRKPQTEVKMTTTTTTTMSFVQTFISPTPTTKRSAELGVSWRRK